MFKVLLSGALAIVLWVSGTGRAMSSEEPDLKSRYLEDCQSMIKHMFYPPSWRNHSKSRSDNEAVIRFKLQKEGDFSAKDIVLVRSSGDPDFAKAAEHTIRHTSYRPNLLNTDPVQLECTFTENRVTLKLL